MLFKKLDYPFINVVLLSTAAVIFVVVQIVDQMFITTASDGWKTKFSIVSVVFQIFDQMEYPWL